MFKINCRSKITGCNDQQQKRKWTSEGLRPKGAPSDPGPRGPPRLTILIFPTIPIGKNLRFFIYLSQPPLNRRWFEKDSSRKKKNLNDCIFIFEHSQLCKKIFEHSHWNDRFSNDFIRLFQTGTRKQTNFQIFFFLLKFDLMVLWVKERRFVVSSKNLNKFFVKKCELFFVKQRSGGLKNVCVDAIGLRAFVLLKIFFVIFFLEMI